MAFNKIDLDNIKAKILISEELDKKTKVIKKEKIFGVAVHFIMKKLHHVKLMMIRDLIIVLAVEQKGTFLQFTKNYLIILS